MNRLTAICAAGVLAFSMFGCSSDDGPPEDPFRLSFTTPKFTVPTGDHFECFYTDTITDRDLAVYDAEGTQVQGGHHITIYYTDIIKDPQHHPCDDAEMADWRQVGGAGNTGEGDADLSLPDGLGLLVPEGVQLVLQSHYIDLSDNPKEVQDTATLLLKDPEEIEHFVNQFLVFDSSFNVAPGESLTKVTTCRVKETVNIVNLVGHMHEWGKEYMLERVDAEGNRIDMIYDASTWHPEFASNPPVQKYTKDEPLVLEAGTLLRQTCTWWNHEDYPLIFPREMCLAFGQYYPDNGEQYCELVE